MQEREQHEQADKFAEYLTDGETILWQGEGRRGGIVAVIVWLLWIGFALTYIIITLKSHNNTWLMGIPFVIFGVFSLFRGVKKIYYSVTDRRILVLKGDRLKAYYISEITDVEVKLQGKRGWVRFGTKCLTKEAGEDGYYRVTGEIAGIENQKEVFDILNNEIYRIK